MEGLEIKITLEVNGKKIKLNEEEAREVYNKLHGLFGNSYSPYPITWPTYDWNKVYKDYYAGDSGQAPAGIKVTYGDNTGKVEKPFI